MKRESERWGFNIQFLSGQTQTTDFVVHGRGFGPFCNQGTLISVYSDWNIYKKHINKDAGLHRRMVKKRAWCHSIFITAY